MKVFKKEVEIKDTPKLSDEVISQFYDEVMQILVPLPNAEVAAIYNEMNAYQIPEQLKNVTALKGLKSTMGQPLELFRAFSNIVQKICPKQEITKNHYSNLLQNKFSFGSNYLFERNNGLLNDSNN